MTVLGGGSENTVNIAWVMRNTIAVRTMILRIQIVHKMMFTVKMKFTWKDALKKNFVTLVRIEI
jgi:hypothetical protein